MAYTLVWLRQQRPCWMFVNKFLSKGRRLTQIGKRKWKKKMRTLMCVCMSVSVQEFKWSPSLFPDEKWGWSDLICSVCVMNETNLTLVYPANHVMNEWMPKDCRYVGDPLMRDFRKDGVSGGGEKTQSLPWWQWRGEEVCVCAWGSVGWWGGVGGTRLSLETSEKLGSVNYVTRIHYDIWYNGKKWMEELSIQ